MVECAAPVLVIHAVQFAKLVVLIKYNGSALLIADSHDISLGVLDVAVLGSVVAHGKGVPLAVPFYSGLFSAADDINQHTIGVAVFRFNAGDRFAQADAVGAVAVGNLRSIGHGYAVEPPCCPAHCHT